MTEMTKAELDEAEAIANDFRGGPSGGLVAKLANGFLHLAERLRQSVVLVELGALALAESERELVSGRKLAQTTSAELTAKLAEAEATIHSLRTYLARYTPVLKGPTR